MKRAPILVFLMILMCSALIAQTRSLSPAVVSVVTKDARGNMYQGTAFFVAGTRDLITCYHVIRDAQSITLSGNGNEYYNIEVVGISPEFDIARLRVDGRSPVPQGLAISGTLPPNLDRLSLRTFGYPSIMSGISLSAISTSDTFMDWTRFKLSDRWIFKQHLDLIGIEMDFNNGMSGAPVVANDVVIGIISGSYKEGGSLGWAIPLKYLERITKIGLPPGRFVWPPSTLLADNRSASLRRSVKLGPDLAQALDHYAQALDKEQTLMPLIIAKSPKILQIIDSEIAKRGPGFPFGKDDDFQRLQEAIYSPQEKQLLNDSDGGDYDLSDALDDLTDAVVQYLRLLPPSSKNQQLRARAMSSLKRISSSIDNSPVTLLADAAYNAANSDKTTLADFRKYFVAMIATLKTGGAATLNTYFQSFEDIVEDLFQAGSKSSTSDAF